MSSTWDAKASAEVVQREWIISLGDGDLIDSVTASASGVTVNSTDYAGDTAFVELSGGVAGVDGSVTLTVGTVAGLSFVETFIIPIRALTPLRTVTVLDVVTFALRKVIGDGETPSADQASNVLEMLTEMLAFWRLGGVDTGVTGVMALSDTLDVPDEYIPALKYALREQAYAHYGAEMSAVDARLADEGRRALSARLVRFDDLNMPTTLTRPTTGAWVLF